MTDAKGVPIRRLNPPELGSPSGYSQIVEVRASRLVFIAGQTALGRDGALVGKNDFAAQAEQVFRNLGIALETARNRFFATVTPPAAPAVTLVEVSKLYGPDFLIEIEAVAASAT